MNNRKCGIMNKWSNVLCNALQNGIESFYFGNFSFQDSWRNNRLCWKKSLHWYDFHGGAVQPRAIIPPSPRAAIGAQGHPSRGGCACSALQACGGFQREGSLPRDHQRWACHWSGVCFPLISTKFTCPVLLAFTRTIVMGLSYLSLFLFSIATAANGSSSAHAQTQEDLRNHAGWQNHKDGIGSNSSIYVRTVKWTHTA